MALRSVSIVAALSLSALVRTECSRNTSPAAAAAPTEIGTISRIYGWFAIFVRLHSRMTVARVSAKGARRWLAGHPWIYRSDVTERPMVEAGAVLVHDNRGKPLGW